MGDTIDPNGWDVGDFEANPVALWAHDSMQPPIGRASAVAVEGNRLMGNIEFIPAETYAFAETVFRMIEARFLNAVSVGFLPVEYSFVENDPDRGWGIDFKRQKLLEISVCPIPANPNALAEARAKGIDTRPLVGWAEKLLEGGGNVIVPRSQLLALRRQAKEPRSMAKRPRLRSDEPMSEEDSSGGGTMVGNCGRPADKDCGMKDPSECSIHGFGGSGTGDPDDNDDKDFRSAVRQAVRSEMRRLRGTGRKRLRRKDGADGDGTNELPEGHEETLRTAAMHFKAAEDYYDAGDDHHDEGMNLMDEATKDFDGDGEPPADHAETVRSASARFKSAEALYDLGDEHHDKAMSALDKCVKALDGEGEPPATGTELAPADAEERIAAALRRVAAARRAA